MNLLLEINPNEKLGFLDALAYGGQTVLIGMLAVFSVLIIIWIALVLLKLVMPDASAKKSVEAKAPQTVAPAPVALNNANDEIVAVIAAAIAMAESEGTGTKFRVVSFKRK